MDLESSTSAGVRPQKRLGVFRACNACRRRKIKCDGNTDCRNCVQIGLKCTYTVRNALAKSRQSIIRGRVIEMCKEDALQEHASTLPKPHSKSNYSDMPSRFGLFPIKFFWDLVEDYCTYTLPTVPIIGEEQFRSAIQNMSCSSEDYALVCCLAAQTVNLTRAQCERPRYTSDDARTLYEMALRARGPILELQQLSVRSVLVSVLVSMGMFAMKRDAGMGTYYNREAIAGLQALRIDDNGHQASLHPKLAAQRERLYWLVFVHDRFHSISSHQFGILSPLPQLPAPAEDITVEMSAWLVHIVRLFVVVDDDFLRFHRDKDSSHLTLSWIEQKHSELGNDNDSWSHDVLRFTDMQQVDLIVTRYWLRTLVWQIALHKFALASNSQDNPMSLEYPIRISHQLRHLLTSKPQEMIEVHGTGILQKIFDIVCTVGDILLHVVSRTCSLDARSAHLDSFLFLYTFLFKMSKFYDIERNILAAKLEEVQSVFPDLVCALQFSPGVE